MSMLVYFTPIQFSTGVNVNHSVCLQVCFTPVQFITGVNI